MRQIIIAVIGVVLIAASFFGMKQIAGSKKPRQQRSEKVVSTAFVEEVNNGSVPVTILENGRLVAKTKMDLYAEVQGVMQSTSKEFKAGSEFKKGEVIVRIRNNDYYANLQAQKSVLQNLITSILPDLRLDYPAAYTKWDAYLKKFDMDQPVAPLPETSSEKEKFFITGKNIYTTYYNTKNMELVYQKYTIRAPYSGVLTESLVNPGTVIRTGQRLGEFIDPSVYEMQVSVSQSMITSITKGKQVQVYQPENPEETWIGKIVRINGKVDPTTQTVQVFIDVKGNRLKEGMFLEARIPGTPKNDAFEVNRKLLVNETNLYMVQDSSLLLTPVEVVHKSEKTVIVRGLTNGTQLLTRMIPGAYEGMKVTVHSKD